MDLLTVQEVARLFRVDETTVRRWVTVGALEALELPHHGERRILRIKRSSVDAVLQQGATAK